MNHDVEPGARCRTCGEEWGLLDDILGECPGLPDLRLPGGLHLPADLAETSPQLFISRPTLIRCEGSPTRWLLVTPSQKEEK